ncbi:MAG: primosomal protein N' [Burkholderiales bacterium]
MRIARVALDVPLDALFDYDAGELPVEYGSIVAVPFGHRRAVGVVTELTDQSALPRERVRRVERLLPVAPLPDDTIRLAVFASEYYRCPLGQVLSAVLPTALRRPSHGERVRLWTYAVTRQGLDFDPEHLPKRATSVRRLFAALRENGRVDSVQARLLCPRAATVLSEWVAAGLVEKQPAVPVTSIARPVPVEALRPTLPTEEQADAVRQISGSFGNFAAWLLQGVTGSGKTEVYLQLIERTLALGAQTLLLVPEINLTPQLEARLRARIPQANFVSLHSNLAEAERLARWESARAGNASLVLGTRLAVFTPLPRLGLVIVDEEHDSSFKQQDGARYSARDLAVYLSKQREVPVVLGSATPSLESYLNARSGRFGHLRLNTRPAALAPQVRLLAMRDARLQNGLCAETVTAIRERLDRGEQSLIFINRRGFAPVLLCRDCGWSAECRRCAARLTLHLRARRLRCHHCGHEQPLIVACPACGNQDLRGLGHGTQRLEDTLGALFPEAEILRIDSDSTRRRNAFAQMRERIHADEVDIIVGTQMLAKGHDFPNLTLVAVVDADQGLFSGDFRAGERLFQQLVQVAGRAGRADRPGEVLVQTQFPDHPLYQALARSDFDGYAEVLLAERRRAGFPPYVFQAVLRAEAHDETAALAYLETAAAKARALDLPVTVYDPVPAAMPKVAGRHRAQLLVQAAERRTLQHFLAQWHPQLAAETARRVRLALDVDPIEL